MDSGLPRCVSYVGWGMNFMFKMGELCEHRSTGLHNCGWKVTIFFCESLYSRWKGMNTAP